MWEFKKRRRKAGEEQMPIIPSRYGLAALELALQDDCNRLGEFAAKDFSGENIAFLKQVEHWKDKWRSAEVEARGGRMSPRIVRSLFDSAEQIFQTLVHRESSDFPVNLDDDVYRSLERVFGGFDPATHERPAVPKSNCPSRAMVAPFAEGNISNVGALPNGRGYREFCRKTFRADIDKDWPRTLESEDLMNAPLLPKIPESFESGVFDKAEVAVKQMVLANTWIR